MACVAATNTNDQFTQAWFGTAMYKFDYFQATDMNYSSNTNKLTFTANTSMNYGTIWHDDHVIINIENTHFHVQLNHGIMVHLLAVECINSNLHS